ncbi:MAG: type II toxin-antitoxin system Phd/YefM family antitoxin [Defluviitaleaceae bacterium]|nr:type II toxin-antitoxin system Phd/YefM family antitoxin [Defluviitaleaceae bacterium]
MIQIRPVSDLRNKFPEIERSIGNDQPVFLTKNGYGAMVVMSLKRYADLTDDIESKLDEAEYEASISDFRYSGTEVFDRLRSKFNG